MNYYEIGIYKWVVFVYICTPCMAPDKAIEAYKLSSCSFTSTDIAVHNCSVKNQTSSNVVARSQKSK
jgi:hypothetical protein